MARPAQRGGTAATVRPRTQVVRGANVLEMKRIRPALDPKPFAPDRIKMRTTRDENDVGAALGQQRAEIATQAS